MKITICGGGNLGHVIAGFLGAQPGNEVRVLTRRPELWSKEIEISEPYGRIFKGKLCLVSSDPASCLENSDIVLLCLPGYSIKEELIKIKPYLRNKTAVGSVVSSTGFFFQSFDILDKRQPLFGFQRVPFISRIKKYGYSADLLGYKSSLNIAIEQTEDKEKLRKQIEILLKCPIVLMKNYYEVSLTNSNPLLHTSRLYTLWHDYENGMTYDYNPQFYSDWDIKSSKLLISMDKEFQECLKKLPVREGSIPSIIEYYDCNDDVSLTNKIKSIPAFQGLLSPMIQIENRRWKPDFKSRYFTEDFPYGLKFIHDIAHQLGINCPDIDIVYEWGINKNKC